ncbi:MAG: M23 family metallopeptidase [Ruthenibacterium sp.]
MWENVTQKETQQNNAKTKKVIYRAEGNERQEHTNRLLAIQCILCLAVLAFALFLRNADAGIFAEIGLAYRAVIEQGIDFGSETPLLRFVNGGVESARKTAAQWAQTLKGKPVLGSGGFWPVQKRQVPEGASLEKYALPETLIQPVAGTLTSGFGFRKNPVNGENDFHAGIDLAADAGAPVCAALEGQVTASGYNALRGNYIILHHRAGLQTLYQHLSCGFVRAGERIAAGQRIAAVGETGCATGPHLHFELIVDDVRVNPILQLPQLIKQDAA